MATYTSEQSGKGRPPVVPENAGYVVMQYSEVTVPTELAINDIVRLGKLPPNCVPVDCWLQCDAIDTDAALRLQVGIEDFPAEENIVASSELTTAANPIEGAIARMTRFPAAILQNADNLKKERFVVAKVTTAGTSKVEGKIRMSLRYRQADFGL